MTRIGLTLVILALGCTPKAGPPAEADAEAPARPAETDEQRQQRFETRKTAQLPNDLPGPWKRLLKGLDSRLLSATHRVWSYQTDWKGGRSIALTARIFGKDDAVNRRIHQALSKLKLPGLSAQLEDQTIERGPIQWSVSVDRVVAPKGAKRETQLDLKWRRSPKPNTGELGPCRKPHPVSAPAVVPEWLKTHTEKRSTRRRILSESKTTVRRSSARMQLLYHNGFAHDENVGQLIKAARKAGLIHQSGSGPNQIWSHDDGRKMSLRPVRDIHEMGCVIKGPVLQIKWRGPKRPRKAP